MGRAGMGWVKRNGSLQISLPRIRLETQID